MMSNKRIEALITGVILWILGVVAILLFGNNPLFPSVTVLAVLLTDNHLKDTLSKK